MIEWNSRIAEIVAAPAAARRRRRFQALPAWAADAARRVPAVFDGRVRQHLARLWAR